MHQAGQAPDQELFRNILLHLRNAQVTEPDWLHLMKQTPVEVQALQSFSAALHLFSTVEAVVELKLLYAIMNIQCKYYSKIIAKR